MDQEQNLEEHQMYKAVFSKKLLLNLVMLNLLER